jgi:hypothetical protein
MNTHLKRCVGANDEMCKFPECSCAQTGLVGLPVVDLKFMDKQMTRDPYRLPDGIPVLRERVCDLPIQFADDDVNSILASVKRDAFWLKWAGGVAVFFVLIGAAVFA